MAKRAKTGAAAPPRERRAHARAELTHVQLKAKQRRLRDGFPGGLQLRVHRALSWLDRAEREAGDDDVRFILLWVGFNAAYAGDLDSGAVAGGEHLRPGRMTGRPVVMGPERREDIAVLEQQPEFLGEALPHRGVDPLALVEVDQHVEERLEAVALAAARDGAHKAIARRETARFLALVFDRLYVLRNQLVHGGATWNGAVNRDQVRDGAAVLGWLLPIFIDVMMDNPARDWGRPYYPVVE
jgi:hypothetical protein